MKGSHVILVIFLLAFGIFIGYLILSSLAAINSPIFYVGYLLIFCVAAVVPVWGAISIILNDVKKESGEDTSLYEEKK